MCIIVIYHNTRRMYIDDLLFLCFVGRFHSSSSGLGVCCTLVSWGVFTAVVVVWVSVVLLCFVGCFHSSSSGLGVCCTLVFRGVFSQQ